VLLYKLDKKLQFIDLANTIAHVNTVLIPTVMGAVATTEQAIINEAHRRDMVVPDRNREEADDDRAAGAYVAFPRKGYHEWIGSMDINSLYPSVFRALNMGNETLVGQVRTHLTEADILKTTSGPWQDDSGVMRKKLSFADSWLNKFGTLEYELVMKHDTERVLHLDMMDGNTMECTGADIYNLVFNSDQPWNISANGTIFRTDIQGVIPGLLERWYTERKELQAKKKAAETQDEQAFWDKRQLVTKISLNSLYGAILNSGCRFFDKRIGQSTTLTGRRIARHMIAKTNELLTGEYDHEGKCIVYGDTDSCYFTAVPALPPDTELDLESAVHLYDNISDQVSASFPEFLKRDFNVPLSAGQVLKAGREVVGRAALFITKKRYAINCWDIEGYQPPGGKLKIMGMDIKRSDTPEFIQDFLEEVLSEALNGHDSQVVMEKIRDFKKKFKDMLAWHKGMPKRVNNLTAYGEKLKKLRGERTDPRKLSKKVQGQLDDENNMIPGHVLASLNWNELRRMHSDNYSMEITDGAKVIVCRLRNNPMGYTSIAYPTDELQLPDWFKVLCFDEQLMEEIVLNKKIDNVLGQMGWDLSKIHESESLREFFEF
jgi:DNA polymerase elongation subunit (family B)